ncbi:unnamed protein product [Arabis nemorensis]|uniref:Transmembrane protein n=1 Tax=Arabis nemorensis TaxID=586526 RepID=A0A565ALN3_9BRAS|nr:unnamed protein product [Arabis nemorensis]
MASNLRLIVLLLLVSLSVTVTSVSSIAPSPTDQAMFDNGTPLNGFVLIAIKVVGLIVIVCIFHGAMYCKIRKAFRGQGRKLT